MVVFVGFKWPFSIVNYDMISWIWTMTITTTTITIIGVDGVEL